MGLERGGEKIGIICLTTVIKTGQSSRPDIGTPLLDEVLSAQTEIDALTRIGIDSMARAR